MPNLKELKNRISSVKSTRKITSAMKMVAASKLRRAQDLAESSRVYADSLSFILSSLAGNTKNSSDLPEILTGRENSKISLLIINSSDRGLCGGFNSNLFKNTKKSKTHFNYSGINPTIALNYVLFKTGDDFEKILEKTLKNKFNYIEIDFLVVLCDIEWAVVSGL